MSSKYPLYQCRKMVRAIKLSEIRIVPAENDGEVDKVFLTPSDGSFSEVEVDRDYLAEHQPEPGGYLVIHENGKMSFSPADVFETDYIRL